MTVIINETSAVVIVLVACVVAMMAYAVIRKEGATDERRKAYLASIGEDAKQAEAFHVKTLMTIVPLILLILGSKQVGTLQDAQAICRKFFGHGKCLCRCYQPYCMHEHLHDRYDGHRSYRGTDLMEGSQAAAAGTFGPFFIAVISGSGDAAAVAFNGAITPFAEQFVLLLFIMDLDLLRLPVP